MCNTLCTTLQLCAWQAAHTAAEEARRREVQEVANDRDEHVRQLAAQQGQVL